MGLLTSRSVGAQPTKDVIVANTPLPVQGTVSVGNFPAAQNVPMAVNVDCLIPFGQGTCNTSSANVPTGKVFVIETIVASAERNSTGNMSAIVGITTNGTAVEIPLSWVNQGLGVPTFGGRFLVSGPLSARLYADGGTAINLLAISGSHDSVTVTLSGYLTTCDLSTGCALR
jgi:hypothetical protein